MENNEYGNTFQFANVGTLIAMATRLEKVKLCAVRQRSYNSGPLSVSEAVVLCLPQLHVKRISGGCNKINTVNQPNLAWGYVLLIVFCTAPLYISKDYRKHSEKPKVKLTQQLYIQHCFDILYGSNSWVWGCVGVW